MKATTKNNSKKCSLIAKTGKNKYFYKIRHNKKMIVGPYGNVMKSI